MCTVHPRRTPLVAHLTPRTPTHANSRRPPSCLLLLGRHVGEVVLTIIVDPYTRAALRRLVPHRLFSREGGGEAAEQVSIVVPRACL